MSSEQGTVVMQASADDWDQHWQQIGASAEKGPASKYRRRTILRLLRLKNQGESARLLDIGSGTGEFAEEFSRRYPRAQYLGLELSRTGVEVSSRRVPTASFLQCDLLQPGELDKVPDFRATHAVCSEVLEHLDEPVTLLRNASRYLAPGCQLIVTVPGGPMNAFDKHIGHRRHFTPMAAGAVVEEAGFRVERLYGVGFPFFNLYRLFLAWRGEKLIHDLSGRPSMTVRFGMGLFDLLFRMNLMRWGWQTVVVARYPGGAGSAANGA